MQLVKTDMFGVAPGTGSPLDVLLPSSLGNASPDRAAMHARDSAADETVLVTGWSRVEQWFTLRVFGTGGETPFVTHSMAGAAAALVSVGVLNPGPVTVIGPDTDHTLWTDGTTVRVPVIGPVVYEPVIDGPAHEYGAAPYRAGVGRGFLLVDVSDDLLSLPAPDIARMDAFGCSDLTLVRQLPGDGEIRARVFAPGFGMPEDAGCLPVAAALGLVALRSDPRISQVMVRQVSCRGSESVLTCIGKLRNGNADLQVSGRVRTQCPVPEQEPDQAAPTD